LDFRRLSGIVEVDKTSRAALIQGGTLGPDLEEGLKPSGLTLRHFPQSFEFSTLGGWIATRAGGHFATLYTHIDDLVESMTVVTPTGTVETRRLPGSGAGPSADRFFLGSEGALGIITRAWMRLQARPTFRASRTFRFSDFYRAAAAARGLAQSGLFPANCRLLDATEALINGVGDGVHSFLLVSFESADHALDAWLARASELALDAGGEAVESVKGVLPSASVEGDDASATAADRWRKMFLRGPYLRDALARMGLIIETFETAVVWRDFESFHREVKRVAFDVATRVAGSAVVSSRVTHVYPDGAAPYFTVIAPAKTGSQLAQWDEIKVAVSDALVAGGGTITHHHAVGRDHHPWYAQQRSPTFARVLAAAKRELDPEGILNPGVIA
jgi:alkyldihydroxyacetonephosphate synthase